MVVKDLITPAPSAIKPAAARYLQLPTQLAGYLQQYFRQPVESRWLPSNDYLFYRERDSETELATPERLLTTLEIGRLEEYLGDQQNSQPKVLLRRGGVAKAYAGIGANLRQGMAGRTELRGVTAHLYSGTVVCFAMSRMVGQADHLGAEVEQMYSHFGERMRKELCLTTFRVSQIGDVGVMKEFPKFFVVPVVIDYAYEDSVQVSDQTITVRNVQLNIK